MPIERIYPLGTLGELKFIDKSDTEDLVEVWFRALQPAAQQRILRSYSLDGVKKPLEVVPLYSNMYWFTDPVGLTTTPWYTQGDSLNEIIQNLPGSPPTPAGWKVTKGTSGNTRLVSFNDGNLGESDSVPIVPAGVDLTASCWVYVPALSTDINSVSLILRDHYGLGVTHTTQSKNVVSKDTWHRYDFFVENTPEVSDGHYIGPVANGAEGQVAYITQMTLEYGESISPHQSNPRDSWKKIEELLVTGATEFTFHYKQGEETNLGLDQDISFDLLSGFVGSVMVHDGSVYKPAIPWINDQGTWKVTQPWVRTPSGWKQIT